MLKIFSSMSRSMKGFAKPEVLWTSAIGAAVVTVAVSRATIPTTLNDFFGNGSLPTEFQEILADAQLCWYCHGGFESPTEPHSTWSASMMGQAARDPAMWAALAIANQDADYSGEWCLRCHVPVGWMNGRSVPPDGAQLEPIDFDGVSCIICHRMVDPVYTPGQSPPDDAQILDDLTFPPLEPGNASYVIDPLDRRRGPLVLDEQFNFHEWRRAEFQASKSEHCGTCHEVSNPAFSKQPDGSYRPNAFDAQHPTLQRQEMFPLDRTYSEWKASAFADAPIDMQGRFGGDDHVVSSCQSCHMPTKTGFVCNPILANERTNMPRHFFNGGNTWVLRAVRNLYPDEVTSLTADTVAASIDRAKAMLGAAGDLELTKESGQLKVRIINQTGHKLPTGYHEGRRMWINVKFFDASDAVIAERGAYDNITAVLTTADTKIYENVQGMDAFMANLTGNAVGESFHHAINNVVVKDNRIPPRGFTNAEFAAAQASPVGATYADGQYWDDTSFAIPLDTRRVEVRVFYQTTSKEYIEFLETENTTNDAGTILRQQWELTGKSEPALMDLGELVFCAADYNADGVIDFFDYLDYVDVFSSGGLGADFNSDGIVDFFDYLDFIAAFSAGCP